MFGMECPKCRSTLLMIRHKTGLERLRVFFTGLREYRCRDCDQRFRAADRRQVNRDRAPYADKAVARSA
jgi:DNA-directed RNA polymerase subunit RPC12/RpoP